VPRSFKDQDTEVIWNRRRSRRLDGPTQRVAWRKLAMLDTAEILADLRIPPGNRLEKLRGDLELSQYQLARSIGVPARRINEIVHGQRRISADTALRLAASSGLRSGSG
jgi:addiction module HigA family antidote